MHITGSEILRAALEAVTSQGPDTSDEELDRIARRSRFVIDSANLGSLIGGERSGMHRVTLTPGRDFFTWGYAPEDAEPEARPDIVSEGPPTRVDYWTVVLDDYERTVTPNGRLTPLDAWIGRDHLRGGSEPRMLYWQRDLTPEGWQCFRVAPTPAQAYEVRVYAQTPAIVEVRRGSIYDLPQGVANFIIRLLAVDTEEAMGLPPRAELRSSLQTAKQNLTKIQRTARARATSPDWLDLDGYAGRGFDHGRGWR